MGVTYCTSLFTRQENQRATAVVISELDLFTSLSSSMKRISIDLRSSVGQQGKARQGKASIHHNWLYNTCVCVCINIYCIQQYFCIVSAHFCLYFQNFVDAFNKKRLRHTLPDIDRVSIMQKNKLTSTERATTQLEEKCQMFLSDGLRVRKEYVYRFFHDPTTYFIFFSIINF